MAFYAGLDVHKEHINAAVVDSRGKMVKEAKFMNTPEALDAFLSGLDGQTEFALEACGFYEPVYDWIDDRGFGVTLTHPKKVKAIASAKIKTDVICAETIAQLNRADLLPKSYVPPKHIREVRNMVRHRASLVRHRSRVKHCIHGILLKEGVKHPFSDLFGVEGTEWLKKIELKYSNRLAVDNYLAILDAINEKILLATCQIEGIVDANPNVKLLTTMPGIGSYSALFIASEIADIKRFPNSMKLSSYAGIVPSIHQSATTLRRGHITKEGNKLLRWILIQCAHSAVVSDKHLGRYFNKLKRKKGANIAIVAVARKMLSYMYIMLTERREFHTLSVSSGGKAMG